MQHARVVHDGRKSSQYELDTPICPCVYPSSIPCRGSLFKQREVTTGVDDVKLRHTAVLNSDTLIVARAGSKFVMFV